MAPDHHADERPPEAELAESQAVKDAEVLDREGVEQELMQEDESDLGEQIEDIETDE